MLSPVPLSDEELYSRFQSNVAILSSGMKREAAAGDVVGAISLAWGADTSVVEAVLWEHSTVLARYPTRKFFQLGENLVEQVPSVLAGAAPSDTASGVVERARSAIVAAAEPSLRNSLSSAWTDVADLHPLPAPSEKDLLDSVRRRTGGLEIEAFITHRRQESVESMTAALGAEASGETATAIEMAYASDLYALEGYLVESAIALGDTFLMTVTIRWELITEAIAMMADLPQEFAPAVEAIRAAVAAAVGEAEWSRLSDTLQPHV